MSTAVNIGNIKAGDAHAHGNIKIQAPPAVLLTPNFAAMPDELKQLRNWVLWRYLPPKRKGAKGRKVPFQPNGQPASSTNPSTWATYDECCAAYQQGDFSGIGFVFDGKPDENGLVYAGVDFDSVACEGEASIQTAEWVDDIGSYVETSVSGTGLHVITKAQPLQSGISNGGIELYTRGRYFTMTGRTAGPARPLVAAPATFVALAKQLQAQPKNLISGSGGQTEGPNGVPFEGPYRPLSAGPAGAFAHLPVERSTLEPNIEKIQSAAAAIPAAAIADEPQWINLARALAHHAAVFPDQVEPLWQILDAASRQASGYDTEDNRRRFDRYIGEAFHHQNPITVATLFYMAQQYGWRGWPPQLCVPGPPAWSLPDLTVSFANIPHRQWLYGTYLIRGELTVEAAPGGAGKTAHATAVSVEIAAGRELLGEKVWISGDHRVLYLNGEDSSTEIKRRLFAFAQQHNLTEQDLSRLYVAGADDPRVQSLSFLSTNEKGTTIHEAGFAGLETALDTVCPDLLVLDPLVVFCGGANMNDNALMAVMVRKLKALAVKYDCAVLIIHHTRKGKTFDDAAGEADRISGAAAIVNLARRAIMPVTMNEAEAKTYGVLPSERLRYFKLVDAKSNLAPLSANAPWYELVNVELPNPELPTYPSGDRVQAVKRAQLSRSKASSLGPERQAIRFELMKLIDRGLIIDGEKTPYSPNSTGNNKMRAILDRAIAAVEQATPDKEWLPRDLRTTAERELEDLKHDGWVVVETIKNGRFRRSHGLRPVWERTPWAKERENLHQHGGPTVRTEQEQEELDRNDLKVCLDEEAKPDGQLVNGMVN